MMLVKFHQLFSEPWEELLYDVQISNTEQISVTVLGSSVIRSLKKKKQEKYQWTEFQKVAGLINLRLKPITFIFIVKQSHHSATHLPILRTFKLNRVLNLNPRMSFMGK